MAWLINSMEEEIGRLYLFLPIAKDIWEIAKETYSDMGNSAQISEIKSRLRETKQGNMSVTQYYSLLAKLWQELDLFYEANWSCSQDNLKYTKMLEKERVFEFLAGLNKELDEVRGRVLGKESLPSIREVFAEVRREESRRKVMMGDLAGTSSLGTQPQSESSALVSKGWETHTNPNVDQKLLRRGEKIWCEYCHRPKHTKATCWKLHGRPSNWKTNKPNGKGFHADVEENTSLKVEDHPRPVPFSKEQLEHLHELFSQSSFGSFGSSSHSCSFAETGNSLTALHTSLGTNKPWVIDSGASDHMSGLTLGEDDWQC
ncbi:uncharacterized protein LOC116121458 [Pistacia vera]|uniref:uncharacterized protein LOC116121458 n=1 Tax=Pistacia vera TaxID=55513 RepID=UPI001262E166|nr:uncharacterized protein LOC116121458 [Pistacia vera]